MQLTGTVDGEGDREKKLKHNASSFSGQRASPGRFAWLWKPTHSHGYLQVQFPWGVSA